ncbi:hypothetical protein [Streptosporangium jomthongense]|uniref:Uncharacterized protein n=1 Tax=Streptosporangium jomthongense TaxID=1193683 RepID=A0ABV8F5N9_9ACTN
MSIPEAASVGPRWRAVRQGAGYCAAGTMSLYLLVKVIWVARLLLGGGSWEAETQVADWALLNALTVVMAAAGVALGLSLARPWGMRIPAPLLLLPAWTAAGFLVPMLPYMVVSALLGDGSSEEGARAVSVAEPAAAGWEMAFLAIGFAGMGLGLAVGLPIYLRERWPWAFLGRVGDLPRVRPTWRANAVRAALAVAAGLGVMWSFWAVGGTVGLRADLGLNGRLLAATSGAWAFAAAGGVCVLTARVARRLAVWFPMAVAFAGSGFLTAWSGWKLGISAFGPDGFAPREHLPVAFAGNILAVAAGVVMVGAVLQVYRSRAGAQRAS